MDVITEEKYYDISLRPHDRDRIYFDNYLN